MMEIKKKNIGNVSSVLFLHAEYNGLWWYELLQLAQTRSNQIWVNTLQPFLFTIPNWHTNYRLET